MKPTFQLGRIGGIAIGIHYSLFLAAILIAWSLAVSFFPYYFPEWSKTQYWSIGVVAAILLFASVLIHELAHSFVAIARGHEITGITLFIFGGVSNIKAMDETARDEFVISVVGPITSAILGGISLAIWMAARAADASLSGPLAGLFLYLALVNLLLAAFNILPGFPLDGGRVFRSIVWMITGNVVRATDIAATVGSFFGWALILGGVIIVFMGDFISGIWLGLIGWFLWSAAGSTRTQVQMEHVLKGLLVQQIMEADPPRIQGSLPIDALVRQYFVLQGRNAVLVNSETGLGGIVTLTDLNRRLKFRQPDTVQARDIMTPAPLISVEASAPVIEALQTMQEKGIKHLVVTREGAMSGMITLESMQRYFRAMRIAKPESRGTLRPPTG